MRSWTLIAALVLGLVAATADADPRVVEIGLYLIDITAIDERAENYTAEFDVIARWQDPARAFTPADGEDVPRVIVGDASGAYLNEGWNPEIYALNALDTSDRGRPRLIIEPDGTITLRNRLLRTLSAKLDFRDFPFDHQVLPVYIESVVHDSGDLRLENAAEFTGFDPSFEMPEWGVIGLATESEVIERVQEKQSYDRLSFLVRIDRHEGYYIWKIMLPMVVIVMLSWIVFWMSDEMLGRRAGVSSTCMLTIIAYQFVVADALPRFPYQTIMDRFVLVSLLTIAATMVVNLVGSRLEIERRRRLDRVCRAVFAVVFTAALVFVLTAGSSGA